MVSFQQRMVNGLKPEMKRWQEGDECINEALPRDESGVIDYLDPSMD